MLIFLLISVFLVLVVNGDTNSTPVHNRNFVYDVYEYDVVHSITLNATTEQILDFRESSDDYSGYPSRVHISCDVITAEYPLLITATQQKGVSSWQLPLSAGAASFTDMARTLCPHAAGPNLTSVRPPRLELSTASPRDVTVDIKLRRFTDFYLRLDEEANVTVNSPSSPKYYYFSFDTPTSVNTTLDSVLLTIESDDQVCALVSIQNNSCPVFDSEHSIPYQGHHLTMSTKGGITLTRATYPRGFYVVLVVKLSDGDCSGGSGAPAIGSRAKHFRILAQRTVTLQEYLSAGGALLALLALVYALTALLGYLSARCEEDVVLVEELATPSSSSALQPLAAGDLGHIDEREVESESEPSSQEPTQDQWDAPTLDQLCRAQPRALKRQANRFVWGALTLAVVYTLPVMQLLITYQNMALSTGDQDVCYYNFLCSVPLAHLADSNHVISNAPYVLLGLGFMLLVRGHRGQSPGRGPPPQHGLLHALGLALAMEGVLSACYHLCPNKMNFQFDSSFMYVISVLWLAALYRRRHADLAAPAHLTFALIAVLIATGVIGITFPTLWFWILFSVAHLTSCLALTVHLYYFGRFKIDGASIAAAYGACRGGVTSLRPRKRARAALLLLMNGVNWTLAGLGLYNHNSDFARHLLAILLSNTVLYTVLYVCMKLVQREKVEARCWALLVLAGVAWAAAGAFFVNGRSKWRLTPAQSREHNAPCTWLHALDTHDLWHALSAVALFLSFNLLLHIDDPLRDTPRDQISVF